MKNLKLNELEIGEGAPLCLIGGPCVIETEEIALWTAEALKRMTESLGLGFVYKSSYSKDNRSSAEYYPGPGPDEGLRILERVRKDIGVPVLSDVHHPEEAKAAAQRAVFDKEALFRNVEEVMAEAVSAQMQVAQAVVAVEREPLPSATPNEVAVLVQTAVRHRVTMADLFERHGAQPTRVSRGRRKEDAPTQQLGLFSIPAAA